MWNQAYFSDRIMKGLNDKYRIKEASPDLARKVNGCGCMVHQNWQTVTWLGHSGEEAAQIVDAQIIYLVIGLGREHAANVQE